MGKLITNKVGTGGLRGRAAGHELTLRSRRPMV